MPFGKKIDNLWDTFWSRAVNLATWRETEKRHHPFLLELSYLCMIFFSLERTHGILQQFCGYFFNGGTSKQHRIITIPVQNGINSCAGLTRKGIKESQNWHFPMQNSERGKRGLERGNNNGGVFFIIRKLMQIEVLVESPSTVRLRKQQRIQNFASTSHVPILKLISMNILKNVLKSLPWIHG